MLREEYCLFANTILHGNQYFHLLHERVVETMQKKISLPVVRFADGEYAFYRFSLKCNGLYQQAESVKTIQQALPEHLAALKDISDYGLLAPLIFPGNTQGPSLSFPFFKKKERDSTAADFLDFLYKNEIKLTSENYMPFYVVYAYLSSMEFASAVHRKNVCILNSDYHEESFRAWFAERNSDPVLTFVEIPREYVATRWEKIKWSILKKIPWGTDICLIGAGVGALLVCKDIAKHFSIPAMDAGHVLNMMNNRMDKSNGVRLYTLWKAS